MVADLYDDMQCDTGVKPLIANNDLPGQVLPHSWGAVNSRVAVNQILIPEDKR